MTITDIQIAALFSKLSNLARLCETHLAQSETALLSWNAQMALDVESSEEAFSKAMNATQEETLRVIALHHPVASDLRRIIHTFKLSQELERFHSYIHRIGRKTHKLCQSPTMKIDASFGNQFTVVKSMLHALIAHLDDPRSLCVVDDIAVQQEECHRLKREIKQNVEAVLALESSVASEMLLLLGISRHLDNMGKLLLEMWTEVADFCKLRR